MLSENPNYFDEDVAANSGGSKEKSFFLFRKRNLTDKRSHANKDVERKESAAHRCRASLRGFLRSRSNSTSSSPMKLHIYRTPEYYNDRWFRERLSDDDNTHVQGENCSNIVNTSEQRFEIGTDSLLAEARRHSIGTFIRKDQLQGSISDEVPEMMAPKAPVELIGEGAHSSTVMDDILVIIARHSEQAFIWANHLKTCFDKITKQRGKVPFNFLYVKIDENQLDQQLVKRCLSTKLQIIIVCPMLLTLSTQFLYTTLVSLLKPEQVLGLLLNVTEARILEIYKDTFPGYNKWRTCTVTDHEQSFLSELLGIATDILGCALRQQPHYSRQNVITPFKHTDSVGFHDTFTLFPRKVKIGQNKVLVILTEPLERNDWIKIKIEKGNGIIEITNVKRRNPYTIQFSVPDSCMEVSMMISVRLEKNNVDIGCRPLKCESLFRELEHILKTQHTPMEFLCQTVGIAIPDRDKLDSYLLQTFQKNVPTNFHLLNHADGEKILKSHRAASAEEYPSLLHFAAYWGLERLCLQLLECPGGDIACEMRNISGRTPGDLAGLGGHYKLADSIKNFSKMNEFTTMYHYFKGISDLSLNKVIIQPKPLSNDNNERSLEGAANLISLGQVNKQPQSAEYMEMNVSGGEADAVLKETLNSVANLNYLIVDTVRNIQHELNPYTEIKKEVEKEKEIVNNLNVKSNVCSEQGILLNGQKTREFQYLQTIDFSKNDLFSQECSNLLENCNVSSNSDINYLLQPSNVPVMNLDFDKNYLIQPSNIPVYDYDNSNHKGENQQILSNKQININHDTDQEALHLRLRFKKKEQTKESKHQVATIYKQESNNFKKSVDDELLEIITDFKNNVFTIQEVEQLVQSWKSRNDVKQSYKDKQEQLQMMRQEYERIQQQMKERLKRPSPFETMKKIFFRNKIFDSKKEDSLCSQNGREDSKFTIDPSSFESRRPISSASNHSISSNSSGRISTTSGTSVGDSGTHSDSEEQLCGLAISNGSKTNKHNRLLENYMIPPLPRPVITTPTPLEVEEPKQTSNDADEHYTKFPSNIPVVPVLTSMDENRETRNPMQSIKIQRHEVNCQMEENRPLMTSFQGKKISSDDTK